MDLYITEIKEDSDEESKYIDGVDKQAFKGVRKKFRKKPSNETL